ncbi:hypothetical protein PHIN8_03070 [Polynucleobacter sp. HIN8]|uniref:sporadic carbohydrate cluster 2OG-Fe(II) oxygenase n=1 Tax=Polynucleobacter sp. HIN8 TaxID=3047867 RepID=UPI002573E6C2|nr:sporadic carbohydrate cluster 2OG-Fe(II) oxygenase [Polynucleobacter sp. HIN8]BEI38363.1 hypothetical protein PHIN8_03070 [Polynucleobacter sp. HIN8]
MEKKNIEFSNLQFKGYEVKKNDNHLMLVEIRNDVVNKLKIAFDLQHENKQTEEFLNKFHEFENIKKLSDGEFNEKRRQLIERINLNGVNLKKLFNSCEEKITNLLGQDIVIQKNINLTIQRPNDPYPTEIHRDSPPNSPYEIALWIPLTDCTKSKALYLAPLENSFEIAKNLQKYNTCSTFEEDVIKVSNNVPVSFGEVLYFSPTLFHYSIKNEENETRFSLNLRIKNMFTPYGLKHPASFFTPIKHSIISSIGLKASQIENDNE